MTPASGVWTPLVSAFQRRFDTPPGFGVIAPGRVNLIGEHTDYNDGFVLPVAIDRYLRVVAGSDEAPMITVRSLQFPGEALIPTNDPAAAVVPSWARYVQGVAVVLGGAREALRGMKLIVGGELPPGVGVSSSAALEMAAALALLHRAGTEVSRREVALLCRRAEAEFVGIAVGVMDQFAVALSRASHALFLDCMSLEVHHVPLPGQVVVVVCDTGIRRALEESAYNMRREECRRAVEALRAIRPAVRTLRDLEIADLALIDVLPEPLRRRARHVVTENRRVIDAADALEREDLQRLGALLFSSHASLRDDYEVSIPALDAMVDAASSAPGCIGARLTGAGFGGAAVAVVRRAEAGAFIRYLAPEYARRTGMQGEFTICEAVGGAQVTNLPGETS